MPTFKSSQKIIISEKYWNKKLGYSILCYHYDTEKLVEETL